MKKSALIAGVLALVIGVSACGSTPESGSAAPVLFGDARELVRAATGQTGRAQTVKFTATATVQGRTITGAGEIRFAGSDLAMKVTRTIDGVVSDETRIVDGVQYRSVPEYAREASGGKPWGRVPADSAEGKELGAMLRESGQSDPATMLEEIQKGGTITRSEQTTLDGQPMSHYWITIDLAKASGLPELAGQTVTMELWLDAGQFPARITIDTGAPLSADDVQTGPMTMRYTDWGAPVDIVAPPADQVGELRRK